MHGTGLYQRESSFLVCLFDSVSTVSTVVRELMYLLLIRGMRFQGDSREFTVTKLSLLGRLYWCREKGFVLFRIVLECVASWTHYAYFPSKLLALVFL